MDQDQDLAIELFAQDPSLFASSPAAEVLSWVEDSAKNIATTRGGSEQDVAAAVSASLDRARGAAVNLVVVDVRRPEPEVVESDPFAGVTPEDFGYPTTGPVVTVDADPVLDEPPVDGPSISHFTVRLPWNAANPEGPYLLSANVIGIDNEIFLLESQSRCGVLVDPLANHLDPRTDGVDR